MRQTVIEISVVFLALRPSILLVASLIYWNVIFYKLKTVDSSAIQLAHQIYYGNKTFSPLRSLNSNQVRIHWVINVGMIVRQYFILNKLWLWKMLAFSIILVLFYLAVSRLVICCDRIDLIFKRKKGLRSKIRGFRQISYHD